MKKSFLTPKDLEVNQTKSILLRFQEVENLDTLLEAVNSHHAPELQNESIPDELYKTTQIYDALILTFIIFGSGLCSLSYNKEFNEFFDFKNQIYLYINMGFSGVCCILMFLKQSLQLQIRKLRMLENKKASIFHARYFEPFLIQIFIILMHPYPFLTGIKFYVYQKDIHVNIYYSANDLLQLLNLIRLIYHFKTLLLFTKWNSSSAQRIW